MYNVNDNAAFSAMQRNYDNQMPPDEDERTTEQIAEDERRQEEYLIGQHEIEQYHEE